MKNDHIHQLLIKYFEGNTSLEEERALKEFFSGENQIDPEWMPVKAQFDLFSTGKRIIPDSPGLEFKILNKISESERNSLPQKRFNMMRFAAAAVIIISLVVPGILIYDSQNRIKDTYDDPRIAYMETQKALMFVSQKMNKGMEPLSNISKINTGREQLKKIEKIDRSMGMLNLVSFINQSSNLKK